MSKIKYFGIVGSVFLALFLAASVIDSKMAKDKIENQLADCDKEILKQETRFINALEALGTFSDLEDTLRSYRNAINDRKARMEIFDRIAAKSQALVAIKAETSNQIVRSSIDNLNGALNRRNVVISSCVAATP